MRIHSSETEIRGCWTRLGSELVADDACRRIEQLVAEYLEKVGQDASGWDTLYRDPADCRYWELIYTESDLQGGGPPVLRNVSLDEARLKYGVA